MFRTNGNPASLAPARLKTRWRLRRAIVQALREIAVAVTLAMAVWSLWQAREQARDMHGLADTMIAIESKQAARDRRWEEGGDLFEIDRAENETIFERLARIERRLNGVCR